MTDIEILNHCDHTLLAVTSTWEQVRKACDDGIRYHTASVCIPPCYVHKAKEYVGNRTKICTVIGFPNGYNATCVKVFEARKAIMDGADEIDVVINIGMLKAGDYQYIENELRALRAECADKILKVIIETCLLTDDEKRKMCEIVACVGADFIKSSTGFSKHGATLEDAKLFAQCIGDKIGIKMSGGIRTLDDAQDYLALGVDRLGTSSLIDIIKQKEDLQ